LIKDLFALKLTTFLEFCDQVFKYTNSTECIESSVDTDWSVQ